MAALPRLSYPRRVAIALDTLANACLPGGRVDMTLSTRAYIHQDQWPWRWLFVALNAIAPDHCQQSLENDAARARALAAYLDKHRGPYGHKPSH